MARQGKLTDVHLRNAKPREKVYRLADSGGLCIEVNPSGALYWRLRYRHAGKARMIALGVFPEVSLKVARTRAVEKRQLISAGIDPVQERKETARQQVASVSNTFEAVARDWMRHNPDHLAAVTLNKARWMLETFAFPFVGRRPIVEIKPPEILEALRKVEGAGKLETAHRLRSRCSQVFRYAIGTSRAESDPTRDLRDAIRSVKVKSHAALTAPDDVGELMRRIDNYQGQFVTRCALRLAPLVFVRPGELRAAEWAEIDLTAGMWAIPAARMKRKDQGEHLVPLSRQAIVVLEDIKRLTGRHRLVFPSVRSPQKPMSENTITAALRSMGYSGEQMTGHGFRSTASTLLHELGYASAIIERQLAHGIRNKIAAAYNRAEHLPSRKAMMQAWADHLDELKLAKVQP